jgi:transcriptional regulator with XRE-family HTH domain
MASGKNLIGPTVRRLRYEAKLSQSELAARCQRLGWDITRDTIAKIESRRRWIGDFEVVHLARALHARIEDLFARQHPD